MVGKDSIPSDSLVSDRKDGLPGAEVARFLGVTTSSVNRLVVFKEVSDLKKYLKLF
jgi:hypothetical protein